MFYTHFACSNSADKVVNGKGKFEELIVYSKDIAASTAQLVAASRVKARQRSEKLTALKSASKTGTVYAYTNCLTAQSLTRAILLLYPMCNVVTGATGGVVVTAQSFLDRRKSGKPEHAIMHMYCTLSTQPLRTYIQIY